MVGICCRLEHGWTWSRSSRIAVRGCAFCESRKDALSGEMLAQYFEGTDGIETFADRICHLNGFFAVVVQTNSSVFAAVDRVRSVPLFYAVGSACFCLSDNARWILQQLGCSEVDSDSAAEFLLTGYVTGSSTLISDIKQLQAGELLSFDANAGRIKLRRYYRFVHSEIAATTEEFLERLNFVTQNSIERLTRFARGRTIVIPLSGGLDSRLISMQLKKLGYPRIIAFSYGRPGNEESEVSRQVAEGLRIPWKFVPYSHELWREWYRSAEYSKYVKMADGLCSVAHIQDWPAVWQLSRAGEIPREAVFVPGHSADFVAGSHIPLELLFIRKPDSSWVVEAIWEHHYSLTSVNNVASVVGSHARTVSERLKFRISQLLNDLPAASNEEAVSAYEYWDWQERQAKFIVNSVRVYDYWGYEWWLPWWDSDFVALWEAVPLRLRVNKKLYNQYVKCVEDSLNCIVNLDKVHVFSQRTIATIRGVFHKNGLGKPFSKLLLLKKALKTDHDYEKHPLAWYGITDIRRFRQLAGLRGNINSVLAFDQIENLKTILTQEGASR